tara:strand:- start:576 stop:758 length:183 start_codon:yes stop_codon:yes gene_type:complete
MFEKNEILLIIIALLLAFYFVIAIGAKSKKKNIKIKNYLFGVKALISIIALVSLILWFFL